ncbi:MAG: hypothetical protein COB83_11155 [Gammaproteobacteria bacterium]|nr:MAG: hypothetical protein COB83_11155 [Gammaproteobacteria bacterium]
MALKLTSKFTLLASAVLLNISSVAFANNAAVNIPMLDNAQVFAEFTDEMPAVLNYFTLATEAEIIDFYQQHFNEPTSQERKRGRLTLTYQQEQQTVRIIISQQNNKRQVDVIVNK